MSRLRFGEFVLDAGEGRLWRAGEPVDVQPKVLELLAYLAERPGHLVDREQLLADLWPDVIVTDQSLAQIVSKARAALGEARGESRYLATVHRRGYRFVAEVSPDAAAEPAGNLPSFLPTFVGRAAELATVEELLARGARLVTLVGPGGAGKTRLALEVARRATGDEAWFVDLTEATGASGVLAAFARALRVELGVDPAATLGRALAARGRVLVVLDNAERALEALGSALPAWLSGSTARFLVTTREAVRVRGERVVDLGGLAVADARALFLARAAERGAELDDTSRVDAIVGALDGLPLAIELAAARATALSLPEIEARLARPFDLLSHGPRDATARHATLRGAIAWSWDALGEAEQRALACCSIFAGDFDHDAAARVLGVQDALGELQALCERSLMVARAGGVRRRFRLLETIRRFAAERRPPEAERRYVDHYAELGLRLHEVDLAGRTAADDDLANLLAASRLAIDAGDTTRAAMAFLGSRPAMLRRGPFEDWAALGQRILASPDLDTDRWVWVAYAVAAALRASGPIDAAVALLEEAIDRARGSPLLEAYAYGGLGTLLSNHDSRRAHACLERALACAELSEATVGRLLSERAGADYHLGRLADARSGYEAALAIHRRVGNQRYEAQTYANLGLLASTQGRVDDADALLRASLDLVRAIGDRKQEGLVLGYLGDIARTAGDLPGAAARLEEAIRVHRAVGNQRFEALDGLGLAAVRMDANQLAEAEAALVDLVPVLRSMSHQRGLGAVLGRLAEIRASRGDPTADELSTEADELLRASGDPVDLALHLCRLARIARRRGRPYAAYEAEARALAAPLDLHPTSELARALADL